MAEMFLKLDGIEGESLDFAHAGEIEIKNWEWHTENNVKWDVNQGGQSTKVEIKDIDLKKICDKASVTLYQSCVTGKHIKNGKITCRKNDGDQKVEYLIVTLTDIMVTKVDWIGDGEDPPRSMKPSRCRLPNSSWTTKFRTIPAMRRAARTSASTFKGSTAHS